MRRDSADPKMNDTLRAPLPMNWFIPLGDRVLPDRCTLPLRETVTCWKCKSLERKSYDHHRMMHQYLQFPGVDEVVDETAPVVECPPVDDVAAAGLEEVVALGLKAAVAGFALCRIHHSLH
jgi:hypothetical protein